MKMAEVNDLDSIDYDDDFEYQNQEQEQETTINENTQSDIISDLLKDRGIDDLNKIKFEEDDGTISERSWDSLSNDEKRLILNQTPEKDPEVDLDEQEIEMINQMRLHGMNPEQYVTALRNQGAQYAINQFNTEPNYETDDLTDDELFILDLQYRSPEISEEEALSALENAKSNEELYNKQIAGIRQYYKNLETDMISQKQLEQQEIQNQQFQQYSDAILDSISNIQSIGNLDLDMSQDDQEELAQFILGRDQAGINWFGKALEDPDTVVRMAWFALKGEEAFNDIENYISQQIKTTAQAAYEKGLKEGQKKGGSTVIVPPSRSQSYNGTINDFDLDF